MKNRNLKTWLACLCASGAVAMNDANALTITLPNPANDFRTGSLTSATAGATAVESNLKAAVVDAAFGGTWTKRGHLDNGGPSSLSNDLLAITFTSGAWDATNVAGTWSIASSFWTTYSNAVLGWHVGNGGANPDQFMFLVEQGKTSGTWSYKRLSGGGGGFSNFQLFGNGPPKDITGVPDGGASIVLLGLGLVGVGVGRRMSKKA
jgi:hypothetical protein